MWSCKEHLLDELTTLPFALFASNHECVSITILATIERFLLRIRPSVQILGFKLLFYFLRLTGKPCSSTSARSSCRILIVSRFFIHSVQELVKQAGKHASRLGFCWSWNPEEMLSYFIPH